jgi:hypothetical protein
MIRPDRFARIPGRTAYPSTYPADLPDAAA